MAKNKKNEKTVVAEAVRSSRKRANIAVAIVAGIAALILIAVAVCAAVRVDPMDGIAKLDESKMEHYELYDLNGTDSLMTTKTTQSKIRTALGKMHFSVMNAILQWNWDYSYNFSRNSKGNKIKLTAEEVTAKKATDAEYMVELVYTNATVNGELDKSIAKKLEVDGETVYFDRLKILIGDTDNGVGEIYMYPYIYDYANNKAADDGIRYETYRVTPVKVRANTTETYAALGKIITELNNGI